MSRLARFRCAAKTGGAETTKPGAAETKCAASPGGTVQHCISTHSFGQHGKSVRRKVDLRPYHPHTDRNVWTHAKATLAPDSRHIVAFLLSSTTSRAADSLLSSVRMSKCVLGGFSAAWPGGGFFQRSTRTFREEKSMSWTDERVELLKKLWADGLSASQIANELGSGTRNAVIGKVHRLGLSGRAKSPASSAPRQRKPRSASMLRISRPSIRGNTALAHAYDLEAEFEPEPIDNVIPLGQRRT